MGESYSWKARGVAVRDARHTHDGPEVAKPSATKDTKRWCKGKVGREHKLVVTLDVKWHGYPRLLRSCTTCGKEFGSYSGWGKEPDWVSTENLTAFQRAMHEHKMAREAARRSA